MAPLGVKRKGRLLRRPRHERRTKAVHRRKRLATVGIAVFVISVLSVKVVNYTAPKLITIQALRGDVSGAVAGVKTGIRNAAILHSCVAGTMVEVPGGYVCADTTTASVYSRIFTSYPIEAGAKIAVYPSIIAPHADVANNFVASTLEIPRFPNYRVPAGTDWWTLDPYHSRYWRFYYYSLRPTVALVNAYVATGKTSYLDRLRAMDEGFLTDSAKPTPWIWSDEHAVAFRAMALTYQWWKLREYHVLSEVESQKLLVEIGRTAEFLADPNHYQPEMNHGTNESAALLMVAVSFPDLPGAKTWLGIARTRLARSFHQLIDADGVLIENSPYYDFYELDKFWQVYVFCKQVGITISSDLESVVHRMLRYATYVLQPDGTPPLLGASLYEQIHYSSSFKAMAQWDPEFQYVLTRGKLGNKPTDTSVYFAHAGQTILRSGWGAGNQFTQSSYMTFNVSDFRTHHSQLDSLGVTFYDNGTTLLPPGGLYSYAPGPLHDYFHGTSSHNDVVVDGHSQQQGAALAGPLRQSNGLTYQSAETPVYDGVTDRRTIVMLDKDHYLVLDRLDSPTSHVYDQTWHIFEGAKITTSGLTVTGQGGNPDTRVSIEQLQRVSQTKVKTVIGQTNPPAGLCSRQYQIAVPCAQVKYRQQGYSGAFTTLISAGRPVPGYKVSFDPTLNTVSVFNGTTSTRIHLDITPGKTISVFTNHATLPQTRLEGIAGSAVAANWSMSGAGRLSTVAAPRESRQPVSALVATSSSVEATNSHVHADLSHASLHLRMRVTGFPNLSSVSIAVTSNGWKSSTQLQLQNIYTKLYSGEWLTISLGRGSGTSGLNNDWTAHGAPVDWSRVNGIRFKVARKQSSGGPDPVLMWHWIAAAPTTTKGAVVFVFDDGYQSILPAAAYMDRFGLPGNVAVIGKYTELPGRGYLDVYDLHMLQDKYGWSMVNHTQNHVDALTAYLPRGAMGAYEQDILNGALWLQRAHLNSAPDWFVYPHGTTDAALDQIVGRFYSFARTTGPGPETAPYGSPLRVKTLELHSPGDTLEGGLNADGLTPVSAVLPAIAEAKAYDNTLILTFHRIHARASDRPGYPMVMFRQIVDAVRASGLPVVSLAGLDRINGVIGQDSVRAIPAVPSLIALDVSTPVTKDGHGGFFGWLRHLIP